MRLGSNFIFLAVGRFEEPKDYPNMLRAFSLVIKSIQDVILLIAGDGILRKRMESLSSYLGLSKNVRFLGIRNDIASLMNAADGYVMASAWEGLPIVLLEAASVGLPIVATDVGGNNEVVSNGINGYLVPPNNEVSLADAMRKLICTDKATRKKMGRIANYIIAKNYEIEKVVDIWEGIYSKLC
jgi:glycosyltransferase involved in cell wall biosynthesis